MLPEDKQDIRADLPAVPPIPARYQGVSVFEDLSPYESRIIGGNKDGAFAGVSISNVCFAGATSIGYGVEERCLREKRYACNMDAIFVVERPDGSIFLGLADGASGPNAGDVASGTLTSQLANGLIKYPDVPVRELIRNAENSLMHQYNFQRQNELSGSAVTVPYNSSHMANMKTCLTMLELHPRDGMWQAIPHNIGDSRVILFTDPPFATIENNGAVEHNVNTDDSNFNYYVRALTKCLGLKNGWPRKIEMDCYDPILIPPGTRFLLASDCLSDSLPFRDISLIEAIVKNAAPGLEGSKQIVKEVESLIIQRGNDNKWDNFAVIAGEVGKNI